MCRAIAHARDEVDLLWISVRKRTLAAPSDELAAVLDELARHLEELLCLVHCGCCVVCGLWLCREGFGVEVRGSCVVCRVCVVFDFVVVVVYVQQ
jgi:hypothetical protein